MQRFTIPLFAFFSHNRDVVSTESLFVNLLMSPGVDSQPEGPVPQPYLSYRPTRLLRLLESIPGLLKRLQIRAQCFVRGRLKKVPELLLSSNVGPHPPLSSAETVTISTTLFPLSWYFYSLWCMVFSVGPRVDPNHTTAKKPGILHLYLFQDLTFCLYF
jgi:hypothetical protein